MDDDLPPFAEIDFYFGNCDAALTIMSRGKRFNISFTAKDLRGPPKDETLVKKVLSFQESMDEDPEAVEAYQAWILKPCIPYIDQLAPSKPRTGPPSLAEYFGAETFFLKLQNRNGCLEATRCPEDPSITRFFLPRMLKSDPIVSEAISKGVPCIPASQLVAVLDPDPFEIDYDLVPRTVQAIGRNTQFHFKGVFEQTSFKRELDILLRFKSDSFPDDLPVSRLGGIVTWDDGRSIMGLLVEFIHDSDILEYAVRNASKAKREKWAKQIRATVQKLHDVDIVWGDVKPDNVLIDVKGNAWLIDFNGGRTEGWVDMELEGTKEGDRQGLSNLDNFLGVKNTSKSKKLGWAKACFA